MVLPNQGVVYYHPAPMHYPVYANGLSPEQLQQVQAQPHHHHQHQPQHNQPPYHQRSQQQQTMKQYVNSVSQQGTGYHTTNNNNNYSNNNNNNKVVVTTQALASNENDASKKKNEESAGSIGKLSLKIDEETSIRPRFSDYYMCGDRLGSGTFAIVKKCYRKNANRQVFAVKIIDKKNLTARELVGLKYETKVLQTMEHPSIIKAVDVFENKRTVKIVLEICEGGDLFDQMLKEKDKRLEEHKAAWLICRIARALKYLHEHYVCHRDLKPENILFTKEGHVKISDFGLAHYLKLPPHLHIMHTCCGTPHYVAPEVLGSDEYGVQVDFWSLGVIFFFFFFFL
ncbi:calcium/calmodulin-dependent protein kinase-like protein, partial [Reticulomyxa filosa]